MKKKSTASTVALVGVLGALAGVLMIFEFPLFFAPSFLKFDLSDIPALFAGFFMGPVTGCLVEVVKICINLATNGTSTAYVGEMSNLIGSCVFVGTASILYKKNHTKKGAIISMVVAALVVSVLYIGINTFVTFPMYSRLYGLPMDVIVGMGAKVNPLVKDVPTMMLFSVFPFNLVKYFIVSFVTYLVYKRASGALNKILK